MSDSDTGDDARTAEIRFKVGLNERHMPASIEWSASDSTEASPKSTKSIMLSVWNAEEQKAMRIDLWTDEMLVDEMKLFMFQTLMTMADTFQKATSETAMADEMRRFANRFADKMGFVREGKSLR